MLTVDAYESCRQLSATSCRRQHVSCNGNEIDATTYGLYGGAHEVHGQRSVPALRMSVNGRVPA